MLEIVTYTTGLLTLANLVILTRLAFYFGRQDSRIENLERETKWLKTIFHK